MPTKEEPPPDEVPEFRPIYFQFDTAVLVDASRDRLTELAEYLRARGDVIVTISGHADERGTPEYNIALGEDRARAARDYLVRSGIAATRIRIVSYGEERPVVDGDGEEIWSKNRRDEFELTPGAAASRR